MGSASLENEVGEESPTETDEVEFRFQTVGEQLKAERERQVLTLADMAARTRVPMRHLESIEKSDFAALPGTTYTVGFTRSYARALGLDDAKLSNDLRDELAQGGHDSYKAPVPNYEPADPARVPPRALAWAAAAIAVLLVAGYFVWRSYALGGGVVDPSDAPPAIGAKALAPVTQTAISPDGEVVLTATDAVWVKIYDAQDKRLFEKEMQAGEQYRVPADADKPMIVTGRPQVLTITVGGKAIPALGPADKTIANVELTGAALLARQTQVASPEQATTNSPTTARQPVTQTQRTSQQRTQAPAPVQTTPAPIDQAPATQAATTDTAEKTGN